MYEFPQIGRWDKYVSDGCCPHNVFACNFSDFSSFVREGVWIWRTRNWWHGSMTCSSIKYFSGEVCNHLQYFLSYSHTIGPLRILLRERVSTSPILSKPYRMLGKKCACQSTAIAAVFYLSWSNLQDTCRAQIIHHVQHHDGTIVNKRTSSSSNYSLSSK